MLNHNAWWRYLLVLIVIIVGGFYALPNIFGNSPSVQLKGVRGHDIEAGFSAQVVDALKQENIDYKRIIEERENLKILFSNEDDQLRAREVLSAIDSDNYSTSLALFSASPEWLQNMGTAPMYLGLDLRGGVHFLLEVDTESAVQSALSNYVSEIKRGLREQRIRYDARTLEVKNDSELHLKLRKPEQTDAALELLDDRMPDVDWRAEAEPGSIIGHLLPADIEEIRANALTQNIEALRSRIDQLGVAEPIVQRQGQNRIVLQLPGVQDSAKAKEIIGRAATLEIYLVDERNAGLSGGTAPVFGSKRFTFRDGTPILLQNDLILSGTNITQARPSLDPETGGPVVSITLDSAGAAINQQVTGDNVGNRMAVVFKETISEIKRDANGQPVLDEQGRPIEEFRDIEEVITAPTIRSQLGKQFQIEGLDDIDEAKDIAFLLNAGALAAPVRFIEERTVGPSLGKANIAKGFTSVMVGFGLVLVFMLFYYKAFGVAANIALTLNLVLIVSVLSLLQATLTLPGVAGIVLTVGIAVDANVLIFERIREELRQGQNPQMAIHKGYDSALSTILDANITTLIAAIVLFVFGTGPIKGFAVTLSIGIATSMFTAIVVTRTIVNWYYGGKKVDKLAI